MKTLLRGSAAQFCLRSGGDSAEPGNDDHSAQRTHRYRKGEAAIAAQRSAASRNSGRAGDRPQCPEDAGQVRGQGRREGPDRAQARCDASTTDQPGAGAQQYDFVKLDNDLLVVDPMDSTVVAVIPRKFRRTRRRKAARRVARPPTRRRRATKPRPIRNLTVICVVSRQPAALSGHGACAPLHVCF